jgi:hypothetical protein
VPGENDDYDYALTAIPGEALRLLYEKFGARLLEANVRSFLSVKGKGVNAGIQNTLRTAPERFMAYNNGIVIVADEMAWAGTGRRLSRHRMAQGPANRQRRTDDRVDLLRQEEVSRHRPQPRARSSQDHRHARAGLGQGRGPRLGHLAFRQQPKRRPPIGPLGQQALPRRDRKALSLGLLPRWRGPMVLRARRGQLQHAARARGHDARQAQGLEGGHPRRARVTKTDLAKYITAWDKKPDIVSLGSQKNFDRFMAELLRRPTDKRRRCPPSADYKSHDRQGEDLPRRAEALAADVPGLPSQRHRLHVSLCLREAGAPHRPRAHLGQAGGVSPSCWRKSPFGPRRSTTRFTRHPAGKMVSEWAKRPECKEAVMGASYSEVK